MVWDNVNGLPCIVSAKPMNVLDDTIFSTGIFDSFTCVCCMVIEIRDAIKLVYAIKIQDSAYQIL